MMTTDEWSARAAARAVAAARDAQQNWAASPVHERLRALVRLRNLIASRADDLAAAIVADTARPPAEAFGHELLPVVLSLRWHEVAGPRALEPERPAPFLAAVFGMRSRIEWRPRGVVAAITPANAPFNLSLLPAIPALLAGNALLLKPSEAAPATAGRLAELFAHAFPDGVATVVGGGPAAGRALVDAGVDQVCFIGSEVAGRDVAVAAAARHVPVVLELGGQDAAIVLEDACLDVAAAGIVWAAFVNAGQACCAVERVYVQERVAERFEALVTAKAARLAPTGDLPPLGPQRVARARALAAEAIASGARRLLGPPDGSDRWWPPTVLEGRPAGTGLFDGEVFGPILPVVRVADEDEAVRRANDDGDNLTASIWTANPRRAEHVARRIRAGSISINDHGVGEGAVWAAWGGIGRSGHGRLNGTLGVRQFAVPVHVSSSVTPRRKRPWWFPYDAETTAAFRAAVEAVARPLGRGSMRAAVSTLLHARRAMRRKL